MVVIVVVDWLNKIMNFRIHHVNNSINYQVGNDAGCNCRSLEGCSGRKAASMKNTDLDKMMLGVVWLDNRPCCLSNGIWILGRRIVWTRNRFF